MSENSILKIICSIPVILILLYFLPFVGVCLIIARYFVYRSRKSYELPIVLLIVGIFLLLPRGAELILGYLKMDLSSIPYLSNVVGSELYIKIIKYSKFLLTLGIITLIVSYIIKSVVQKATTKIAAALNTGVSNYMNKEAEIKEKNDLKIKEQQERAKHTHSIKCPTCGSFNLIYEDVGVCKYCRNPISAKK